MGTNLFKDGFAQMIVDGDVSTGNWFVRVIDKIRRALGMKNSQSARNIANLERLFMQAIENKQGARSGDVQYSVSYNDAINQLAAGTLDKTQNTYLKLLDHTPQIYIEKAGAKDLKIITSWETAYLAMNKDGDIPGNYHGLGPDVMKALPSALHDPLYIVKQNNGRIAAITDIVVKGKRSVIVSIEFDTFQTTVQDGSNEAKNYNLIVTFIDAQPNYLQNTIFSGDIVHNKNEEDPAHFILRLKSLKKALPAYDLAGSSGDTVTHLTEDVKHQYALRRLSDTTGNAVAEETPAGDAVQQSPSHGDAATAPFAQGGLAAQMVERAPMSEAQVMERAEEAPQR